MLNMLHTILVGLNLVLCIVGIRTNDLVLVLISAFGIAFNLWLSLRNK